MTRRRSAAAGAPRTSSTGLLALFLALALGLCLPSAARAAPPSVSAPSAILVEPATGDVLFERRADTARPLASVTKLMTALLTLEAGGLSARTPASRYRADAIESQLGLRPGERLTRADLLRGLLLESANDAAVTLAEAVGGSRRAFVRRMNRRAAELGLDDTRFTDPIGLDAGNRASPRDLIRLTRRLRRFEFFRKTVNRTRVVLGSGDAPRKVNNRNELLRVDERVSGVKTGHTNRAGYNLVGSYSRNGVAVLSVVLGTASEAARNADTLALLRYASGRYSRRRVVRAGAVHARAAIRYRRGAELDLVAARTIRRVLRRGDPRPRIRVTDAPAEVEGPIRRGQRLGRAEVLVGSRRVATVTLVAGAAVPEAGVAQQTKDYVTRPFGFLVVLVLTIAAGTLLVRKGVTGRAKGARPARSEVEAA
jgi:D-alanyl-D-alanine carboxypeptidase (penicillin-binding protein 5/6)